MVNMVQRPGDLLTDGAGTAPAAPPYVSFATFRTLLEWLESEGVPLRFDRSFWQAKFSGSTGTQLVATLRFLGLLDGDRPTPHLERLVAATTGDRRLILGGLLRESYAAVPFDELPRATPAMVRAWFRAYPVAGHTLRKAVSFFVNAAKEAGVTMSNAVEKMAKSKGQGANRERASRIAASASAAPGAPEPPHRLPARGRSAIGPAHTTITFGAGGSITVALDVDLFQLSDQERDFVLKLVDLIRSRPGDGDVAPPPAP